MKFSISSSLLSKKLTSISRVINSKDVLPILSHFLFCIKDSVLSVTAADTENSIVTGVPVSECSGDIIFAVNANTMLNAIKEIAEQPITFEVNDELTQLTVTYLNGLFNIPVCSGDTYPVQPECEANNTFVISSANLKKAISSTINATSADELRPVMNGIYFNYIKENGMDVVATDAKVMVKYNFTYGNNENDKNFSFILPKKPAQLLKNLLASCDADITISVNDRNASFKCDDFFLCCRLIEGRYPNYKSVIPTTHQTSSVADRKGFISSLKRVMNFASSDNQLIALQVENDSIHLDAKDVDFSISANEHFATINEGPAIRIGLKAGNVLNVLSIFTAENVQLKFIDPSRPMIVTPQNIDEEGDVLAIVMPMLLN